VLLKKIRAQIASEYKVQQISLRNYGPLSWKGYPACSKNGASMQKLGKQLWKIDKLSHIELTINCQQNCLWAYLIAIAINSARREGVAEYYAAKHE